MQKTMLKVGTIIIAIWASSALQAAPGSSIPTQPFEDSVLHESECQTQTKWICSGYCFLGGDYPTDPWRPIDSEGATEKEARDNLDCDPYYQAGVTCEQVEN